MSARRGLYSCRHNLPPLETSKIKKIAYFLMLFLGCADYSLDQESVELFYEEGGSASKIKGNAPVQLTAEEWPWLGYLKYSIDHPLAVCSGFQLEQGIVVTAAHCVMQQRTLYTFDEDFSLNSMVWSRQVEVDNKMEHHSKAIHAFVPPEAAAKSRDDWRNPSKFYDFAKFDLAIVAILDEEEIACPYSIAGGLSYENADVLIGGYGDDNSGNSGRKMKGRGVMSPGPPPGCYMWKPMGNEWQAKADSGAPAIVDFRTFYYFAVSIDALGSTDANGSPVNYGPKLPSYLTWINASVTKARILLLTAKMQGLNLKE